MKQIVILAGGLATRLYPITEKIPKSMVEICGKPFFEYQIELCLKNGIEEIVLCAGHLAEQIINYFGSGKKFGVRIRYSIEKERLDTGGALKLALPYLDEKFFVMYGDSYLDIDWQKVTQFNAQIKSPSTMTVYRNNWKIEPSKIILTEDNLYVKEFNKENPRKEMEFTEYGLNILSRNVINKIEDRSFPIGRYFQKLIKKKKLSAYEAKKVFQEIGSHQGIQKFKQFIQSGQ